METPLGRADELPGDYRDLLMGAHVAPAWTQLRALMPVHAPQQAAQATRWSYASLRPLLLRAGKLVPMEKAERRVLAFINPGLPPDRLATTPSIFFGLQMIMPGERAPQHRHIPAAARIILEGQGGWTGVDDERLSMQAGDLVLTPPQHWHDHGHEGGEPMIWMDVLDHPLAVPLDISYVTPGALVERPSNRPDLGETVYSCPGLTPYRAPGIAPAPYPLKKFRWTRVRAALQATADAAAREEPVHLRYCNPETGESVLKTMEFSLRFLRPAETATLARASVNRMFLVMEGRAAIAINDHSFDCDTHDAASAPTYARIALTNASAQAPAIVMMIDDSPAQVKLGFYETLD